MTRKIWVLDTPKRWRTSSVLSSIYEKLEIAKQLKKLGVDIIEVFQLLQSAILTL